MVLSSWLCYVGMLAVLSGTIECAPTATIVDTQSANTSSNTALTNPDFDGLIQQGYKKLQHDHSTSSLYLIQAVPASSPSTSENGSVNTLELVYMMYKTGSQQGELSNEQGQPTNFEYSQGWLEGCTASRGFNISQLHIRADKALEEVQQAGHISSIKSLWIGWKNLGGALTLIYGFALTGSETGNFFAVNATSGKYLGEFGSYSPCSMQAYTLPNSGKPGNP